MKKALKIILMYFLFIVAGLVLGTFFYTLYLDVTGFVAGKNLVLFDTRVVIKAAFFVLECLLILISPMLIYYKIKHPEGLPQFVAFLLVSAFTWFAALPLTFRLEQRYEKKHFELDFKEQLSAGYFRPVGDTVYYFTGTFKSLEIDTSEDGGVAVVNRTEEKNKVLYAAASPFRDVLIKNAFEESKVAPYLDFSVLINFAKNAVSKGYSFFLVFLSLGFLLCSLYALSNLFNWRLINTCLLLFMTAAVLAVNCSYFLPAFGFIRERAAVFAPFGLLEAHVGEPLLCLVNLGCGLLFILAGSIKSIVVKKASKD